MPIIFLQKIICAIIEYLNLYHIFLIISNDTAELLHTVQRLNLKEQCIDLSLHFITLCILRSTVSGTRAQNHLRSIGGLEILLDGLGLPSSKFSVPRQSSISKNERCIFAFVLYTQMLLVWYYLLFNLNWYTKIIYAS